MKKNVSGTDWLLFHTRVKEWKKKLWMIETAKDERKHINKTTTKGNCTHKPKKKRKKGSRRSFPPLSGEDEACGHNNVALIKRTNAT